MTCASASPTSWSVFDFAAKQQKFARLEEKSAEPGFWDDAEAAQETHKRLSALRDELTPWRELQKRLDGTEGEEAGIKSATVQIRGDLAYGWLRSERGTHRLVRLSPFDQAHRRHTSFAKVEVMPEVDSDITIEIRPEDVKLDMFRA